MNNEKEVKMEVKMEVNSLRSTNGRRPSVRSWKLKRTIQNTIVNFNSRFNSHFNFPFNSRFNSHFNFPFNSLLFYLLFLAGCSHTPTQPVQLHRLEKVMFDTPAEQLQAALRDHQQEFSTPLLTLFPDNPAFMQQVGDFVSDPVIHRLYTLVDSTFGDMQKEEEALGGALEKMKELYPAMRYDKIYTFVSGMMDYESRVACNSHECLISIDQYVLPYTAEYGFFNTPMYLVRQSDRKYLPVDCLTAMAREHIAMPDETPTLLHYMVNEGKALYLAGECLPKTHDSILLRYSREQYDWMEHNEEHVWTFFLQNKLLFETDYMRFHNFIDEAPQTNAFRDSAPRTTEYIGLRIVRKYMEKTGATVEELFNETDAQKILNESNYRPK